MSAEHAPQFMDMVGLFGEKLAEWDKRIIEITAVGDLAKGVISPQITLQLVCAFHPEPPDDSAGFFTTLNLLLRNDCQHTSEKLGITNAIDLGFKMQEKIYLPDGSILDIPEDQMMIWPQYQV